MSLPWLDKMLDTLKGGGRWLRDLIYGEFVEERPLSVVIADMLVAFVPGVVILLSARDLAAVSLRLGRRYTDASVGRGEQHPEWQEWALLTVCLFTLIAPVIGAAIGSAGLAAGAAVGALAGTQASAILRALGLLLMRESAVALSTLINFLGRFTRADILALLRQVKFGEYAPQLISTLDDFLGNAIAAIQRLSHSISGTPWVSQLERSKEVLNRLRVMEQRFYAVQRHALTQIPHALQQLDGRLARALEQVLEMPPHYAMAGVRTEKPVVMSMEGGKVSSGIGMPPLFLERPAGGHGPPQPQRLGAEPITGANIHTINPTTLGSKGKGIYGEIVSDNYMRSKGHENLVPHSRPPRNLEDIPIGRGIDGVYKNGKPPPPYIVTETKYRTGGQFSAGSLPTTKGSPGYPAAKQMSDRWVSKRLVDLVGEQKTEHIRDAGYERWLMVVDESGTVKSITTLDEMASAIEKVSL
ncbi:hypothetical protein [Pseudomonas fontis]|uniref:Uncharacterized protein n=1 Tax=Pseudomonas fontis TaxID=2942633 RepID=A0ABT5P1I1_9PSED|nr:hypothetical protein [Pseudomonas fontis]MDD0977006.1 hypothetical protein [Pseudomonas fontis]MDD0994237.1 hypothetical protein [Pseudomonas fontis]